MDVFVVKLAILFAITIFYVFIRYLRKLDGESDVGNIKISLLRILPFCVGWILTDLFLWFFEIGGYGQ